jgi:hypothetical protein
MDRFARIVTIVRDIVWTVLGVLLLASVVLLASGGASHLLPAGLGSGGGSGGGSGAGGQGSGNGPAPSSQGPGGAQPSGGQGGGGPQPGPLSVNGSGTFTGTAQGSSFSGNFNVNATQGAGGSVSFTMLVPAKSAQLSFTGNVSCLLSLPTNPPEAIVGGVVKSSTDPARLPNGSGFALGLIASPPGRISFAAGFSLQTTPQGDPCGTPLFNASHPGLDLTSGGIKIQ